MVAYRWETDNSLAAIKMPVASLMFTFFFHFVQSFVLNDSKQIYKKNKLICPVYMLKNLGKLGRYVGTRVGSLAKLRCAQHACI